MAGLDILNGFAGKVISDCIDITVDAIKKADKNRKAENQTMEARIYQVTIDALNTFPYNKYKKKEQVYDAAESILKELKRGNGNYKESVKAGLNMLSSEITGDICGDFLRLLCYEICKVKNRDLAIVHIIFQEEKVIKQQQQMDNHMQEEFEESHQNEKEILEEVSGVKYLIKEMNGEKGCKTESKRPIVNRADEYAKKWNENVFLNNFNDEDENAGVNIKLLQIYIEECLPHYIWGTNINPSKRLKSLLTRRINDFNSEKMLLILGQPGIGKSTLITWIMANFAEKKDKFLVYQFASDLGNVNWQGNHILEEILNTLNLDGDNLENKMLILDGFDEICINRDRERILKILLQELKQTFWMKNFILIITCRENYVDKLELRGIEYITLQAWDKKQIQRFCKVYEEVITKGKNQIKVNRKLKIKINKIIEKKDIMGIPLILYMVLALNVDIGKSSSTVDIYDQIFSLKKGGIYDRGYDVEHRINASDIKKHIHHISQRIAFWMFENNADKATISKEKFEEICENEMRELGKNGEDIQGDTLIGNFFKLNHCEGEGTDELQFVHRSIYEYFVVIYFFESLHKLKSKKEVSEKVGYLLKDGYLSNQKLELVAGKLGELLKKGRLSYQILEFIKYKFDSMKKYNLPDITKKIFNKMLRHGMTYYTKVEDPYSNVIERERNIFSNMLKVVCLWNPALGKLDKRIGIYLQCNREEELNLREIQLDVKNVDLEGAYLSGADLSGAKLSGVNLSGADLMEADLSGADLTEADLSGADLTEADLRGAGLMGADLRGVDLMGADLMGANLRGTDLRAADLSKANLKSANLSRADLRGANLIETVLSATNLRETIFDEKQINELYEKYDLSGCKVYIFKPEEFISYNEYCMRKQEKEYKI